MAKIKVLPYKAGSQSARAIVNELNPAAIMKKQRTPFKGRNKMMLNWGHSAPLFNLIGVKVLNKPIAVGNASNKLTALKLMQAAGVNVPEFTDSIEKAKEWVEAERIVLCRKLLRANSGKGIVIAKVVTDIVTCPLYVKYIRKEKEYRVHVFNGQVIDLVEKKRRENFGANPVYNKYIRSYEQGWIFAREGVVVSEEVKAECLKAVTALGLDFGAVDVVINKKDNKPYVLEVNTAPGLQGTTLQKYKAAVQAWMRANNA